MVDNIKIRALMVERGLTGKQVAMKMGISDKTFYRKLNSGEFGTKEMNQLVDILKIEDPVKIFFAKSVTC